MPETKPKAPLTPEELRWRAAARDPDKAKRNLKLQYILLRCAIAGGLYVLGVVRSCKPTL